MQIVNDFEDKIKAFTGSKYVVALSSGTAAIHLALKASGVENGDKVLVSTFTYIATVNPIIYLGANPLFIDCELVTWNMDPILLEKAIKSAMKSGKKPKAILLMHTYGIPAKMNEIMEISRRFHIPVIEDAAEAFGSTINGINLGTIGQSGIYSFNNNKLLTTYGGGAFVTNDEQLYKKVLFWANQSRESKPYYEYKEIGFNYRMGPLSAAQGLVGIGKVREKIIRRRRIFDNYRMLLKNVSEITWQGEIKESFSNRWLSCALVPKSNLKILQTAFEKESIETRPLWNPMHKQPVFQSFTKINGDKATELFSKGITLPSSDHLTEEEQVKITDVLTSIFS